MEQSRVIGKRILLVEDERWVRECIKRLLAVDGHDVTEAANGVEALVILEAGQFDVVITDFDMPQMNGYELIARIRLSSPLQPIVLITAWAERLFLNTSHANAILGKPFGMAELREVLASLLQRKESADKVNPCPASEI